MEYLIAYLDKNGKGFSDGEPYIYHCVKDAEDGRKLQKELTDKGYKDVTLFNCKYNEVPERITWDFVREHTCWVCDEL